MLVVDASVAVKTVVEEPQSHIARRIFAETERLIVPAHFLGEIGEVLVRRWRAGEVSPQQLRLIQVAWPWSFVVVPLELVFERAFDIAMDAGASFYDALYVAVAERREAALVTADNRLLNCLAGTPWAGRAISLAGWEARNGPFQ
jgi:predicted nucleic acid-binding protein